jgi:HKD family nuclease
MLITQSPAHPSEVRNAISDLIPSAAQEIVVSSAYISLDGSELLMQMLRTNCAAPIDQVPKRIFAALDYGITTPEALEYWMKQPNTSVQVAGAAQVQAGSLLPKRAAFHPKVYAFRSSKTRANLAVGSANLTARGFTINSEAIWVEQAVPYTQILASLDRMQGGLEPLTPALLNNYVLLRKKLPPPPELRKEVESVEPPALPGALSWFWNDVESGAVEPAQYGSMWIEARTLSGGSHSQLELPRGAHRFFGFVFDEYDAHVNKVTIGTPGLRRGLRFWEDKILSWHGNNEMERINLPTASQGGVAYENTAVLFRRLASHNEYELVVAPWDSDIARAWRDASARRGLTFRVGKNSNRQVGLI